MKQRLAQLSREWLARCHGSAGLPVSMLCPSVIAWPCYWPVVWLWSWVLCSR